MLFFYSQLGVFTVRRLTVKRKKVSTESVTMQKNGLLQGRIFLHTPRARMITAFAKINIIFFFLTVRDSSVNDFTNSRLPQIGLHFTISCPTDTFFSIHAFKLSLYTWWCSSSSRPRSPPSKHVDAFFVNVRRPRTETTPLVSSIDLPLHQPSPSVKSALASLKVMSS